MFAEEGADVAINDLDAGAAAAVVEAVTAKGRRAVAVPGDVGRRDQMEQAIATAWETLGPIDILVNNAGIETIVPFLVLTDEQWKRIVDTYLRGAWLCSQIVCRRVVEAKRPASIVNIGSIQAAKVLPGRTHYAPTKLGMAALTRNMSAEMTPLGIRVNCIHPGLIETDMTSWVLNDEEILPIVLAQISMGRPGQPREIGSVAAFFASDEARYVTGQSLFVDGGWEGK